MVAKLSPSPIAVAEIDRLVSGHHHAPHDILGAHRQPEGTAIRTLRPFATSVQVVLEGDRRFELEHLHRGVFAGTLPEPRVPDYRLAVRYGGPDSEEHIVDDPHRYLPTLGELDIHLISEGRHEELWRALGAHTRRYSTPMGEVTGTSFAVWAPNARGVRVIGDFNHWDGTAHPMRSLGSTGVWELFVPGIGDGAHYKYAILGVDGVWREKADPLAFATEEPPRTASVVFTPTFQWSDDEWLSQRKIADWHHRPMSVYEVHLGSWKPGLSYRELATELVEYVRDMGFTHVELLPVAEHPFGGSWGYQITSYYAPTSRLGSPDDFRALVNELHRAGIGVFVDWVPAHFPNDEWALANFDGTALYEHPDPRRGHHPDWGTLIFNYGRTEVRNFLIANALYWLEEFHIDGLRVDAVASMLYLDYSRESGEWEPNQFGGRENLEAISLLKELNVTAYRRNPGITMIAEESTAWPGVSLPVDSGGLGFGFKWNMGWMHDTLQYLARDPVHRRYHHNEITFSMVYAFSENYILPLSHDEVVHGKSSLLNKMPGDEWQRTANLRALLGYMWAHPGKQLIFMGDEIAQGDEWSHESGVQWWLLRYAHHSGVRRLVAELNRRYLDLPALWTRDSSPEGFTWIDGGDGDGNTLTFLRHGDDGSVLACLVNFCTHPHTQRRIGLPAAGSWREILNTDAPTYGGSGHTHPEPIKATRTRSHGQPASARVTLPPLGTVWLVREPQSD